MEPDSDVKCPCGGFGCFEPLVSCAGLLQSAVEQVKASEDSALYANAVDNSLTTVK